MARAKRARRYGPGGSLPGKVPLPRAEDEVGACGGKVREREGKGRERKGNEVGAVERRVGKGKGG